MFDGQQQDSRDMGGQPVGELLYDTGECHAEGASSSARGKNVIKYKSNYNNCRNFVFTGLCRCRQDLSKGGLLLDYRWCCSRRVYWTAYG